VHFIIIIHTFITFSLMRFLYHDSCVHLSFHHSTMQDFLLSHIHSTPEKVLVSLRKSFGDYNAFICFACTRIWKSDLWNVIRIYVYNLCVWICTLLTLEDCINLLPGECEHSVSKYLGPTGGPKMWFQQFWLNFNNRWGLPP
jgi:hypothetical protein